MVTLKNAGGAIRVVYNANGKMVAIPPNTSADVLMTPEAVAAIYKKFKKGDTLSVEGYDPPQPLLESEMPPVRKAAPRIKPKPRARQVAGEA